MLGFFGIFGVSGLKGVFGLLGRVGLFGRIGSFGEKGELGIEFWNCYLCFLGDILFVNFVIRVVCINFVLDNKI